MILTRLGNKKKIAEKIQAYFPKHEVYLEPFFGAGGMFFNKPRAKYNIVNDLDNDVFNLFQVLMNQKDEFIKAFEIMPIHEGLFKYWRRNKEIDPIKKALRFVLLSNFTYLGKPETLQFGSYNTKEILLSRIDETQEKLKYVRFTNCDFRDFLNKIEERTKKKSLIYCDPPYLNKENNYEKSFTKKDSNDLFDLLCDSGCKFCMSEFEHPFIIDQAKKRSLNLIIIGERKNMKNRQTEVLLTNYEKSPTLFS